MIVGKSYQIYALSLEELIKKIRGQKLKYHKCALCGKEKPLVGNLFERLHRHHFLSGIHRKIKIGEKDDKGRTQKIMLVCRQCHSDIHDMGNESFCKKHNKERKDFVGLSDKLELYKENLCK